jgi:hypothetical protein
MGKKGVPQKITASVVWAFHSSGNTDVVPIKIAVLTGSSRARQTLLFSLLKILKFFFHHWQMSDHPP